jgi:hypothetical protein
VVEASPTTWHHKEFSRQLPSDESDLVLAQYRDDGVLNGTQAGERRHDNHGLQCGGQLPGHHGSGADPIFGERGGRRARGVVKLTRGQAAAALVCEKASVWFAPGRAGDQRPERRSV